MIIGLLFHMKKCMIFNYFTGLKCCKFSAGAENIGSSEAVYFVLNVLRGYSLPSVFLDVYSSIEVGHIISIFAMSSYL